MLESAVRAASVVKPTLGERAGATPDPAKAKASAPTLSGDADKAADDLPAAHGAATDTDHVLQHLELFCAPGESTKPVLIKGEAGAGKTYAARMQGRLFEAAYEIGLHASTEACDLLGFPRVDGGWTDGPLSQAFRAAASGLSTQLRLDEFYRPTNQARSILLTCTSPFIDLAGKAFYVLTTGRNIPHPTEPDVYTQETIYAPCHLLAIVATTNVGSQYDVMSGDPAEKRRFAPIHVEVTEPVIRRILGNDSLKVGHLKGIPALIDGCVSFWDACKLLKRDNLIEIVPAVSTFCEAFEHPRTKDADSFKSVLLALGLHVWCGESLDVDPIPEQVSAVTRALNTHVRS
jgi:hypothetical protein